MSTPQAVRHINKTRVLEALRRNGPMSRADIARELAVTRSTASSIVASLINLKMVTDEIDRAEQIGLRMRTGRPSTDVFLNPNYSTFLGVEIGVGRGTIAIVNFAGEVISLEEYKFKIENATPTKVADLVADEVNQTISKLEDKLKPTSGRLSLAALTNSSGHLMRSPFLGWYNVPFLEIMRSALPEIEILGVENDADAFAAAEMHYSTENDHNNVVYLLLDTGVGGCSIVDGKILQGHNGLAGELGHMMIGGAGTAIDGDIVVKGSLESYIGRQALFKRHHELGGSANSISELIAAADEGQSSAIDALNDWAKYFGRGIASIVSILAPEEIVISGPLAPVYIQNEALIRDSIASNLVPGSHIPNFRVSNFLGRTAPAIGAALKVQLEHFNYNETILFGKS